MPPACYRVYELQDPREPGLPRWIGYGPGLTPWTSLWDFREHGVGRLFDWLRDLDANGLEPVIGKEFRMGGVAGCYITARGARACVQTYLMVFSRWAAGLSDDEPGYPDHPPFLLNPKPGPPDVRKPIVAEAPDGKTLSFQSVGEAVEHGFTRSTIYDALKHGTPYKGLLWRYAAGVKSGRGRPVQRLSEAGDVTAFASVSEAARLTGISRNTITRLLETAQPDRDDCRWRDAAD